MIELSPEAHAEVVTRLTALRELAGELEEAFDDEQAATGAREMRASIERMLELIGNPQST